MYVRVRDTQVSDVFSLVYYKNSLVVFKLTQMKNILLIVASFDLFLNDIHTFSREESSPFWH